MVRFESDRRQIFVKGNNAQRRESGKKFVQIALDIPAVRYDARFQQRSRTDFRIIGGHHPFEKGLGFRFAKQHRKQSGRVENQASLAPFPSR